VSRFTTSILLATALLGVLLWIVISMARDFARAPEAPLPPPEEVIEHDPTLPRIHTVAELIAWLDGQGYNGQTLIARYKAWLDLRGFPPALLDEPAPRDDIVVEAADAELLVIAATGNVSALHELSRRSLVEGNLQEAMDWLDQAVINGSLYGMMRKADLINTASDPAIAQLTSGKDGYDDVRLPRDNGLVRALGWSLAAVTVGGYPVVTRAHAARLSTLTDEIDPTKVDLACETAQDFVLEAASSRRALGGPVFSTEQPPFAVTVAEPQDLIPCSVPIVPLVSMDKCKSFLFVDPVPNELMRVWICGETSDI
jgi:hypothetical protein